MNASFHDYLVAGAGVVLGAAGHDPRSGLTARKRLLATATAKNYADI